MDKQERLQHLIGLRQFTESQNKAVIHRGSGMIVTAGAGSGKTRTLVARYLSLLAEGISPRRIVAITFTEKAAREMRNRVRSDLILLRSKFEINSPEYIFWNDLVNQIDSARIGTIHSLCAELLRAYPAEAGLDPEFDIIEEGLGAMFKAESVSASMAWAVEHPETSVIFQFVSSLELERVITYLLDKRLEMSGDQASVDASILTTILQSVLEMDAISSRIRYLQEFIASGDLRVDAGEKMAQQIETFISGWEEIINQNKDRQLVETAADLFRLRREYMDMRPGKKTSLAKVTFEELRDLYDQFLDPWVGGKNSSSNPPAEETEKAYTVALPFITQVFEYAQNHYQQLLAYQRALDFDDLEAKATQLVQKPEVAEKLQKGISFLLVDEFQDTN